MKLQPMIIPMFQGNYQVPSENKTRYPVRVPKESQRSKAKQHVNGISKWISNIWYQHHVKLKSKFKCHIPSNIRPIFSQARKPIGTNNSAKISNTFHLVFVLKERIYTNVPTRESEISHIGVHETCDLFSSTSLRIFDKEKHEQVKAILFIKFTMDLNIFLLNPVKTKLFHKLRVRMYK